MTLRILGRVGVALVVLGLFIAGSAWYASTLPDGALWLLALHRDTGTPVAPAEYTPGENRDAKLLTSAYFVGKAIQDFYIKNGRYPSSLDELGSPDELTPPGVQLFYKKTSTAFQLGINLESETPSILSNIFIPESALYVPGTICPLEPGKYCFLYGWKTQ